MTKSLNIIVYTSLSLSFLIFFFRLKTVDVVVRNTQGAEDVLKKYEDRLRDVHKVPTDVKEVEIYRTELKVNIR